MTTGDLGEKMLQQQMNTTEIPTDDDHNWRFWGIKRPRGNASERELVF